MTPYNFLMVQSDLLFACVGEQTNPRLRRILAKIVGQMTSAADNTDYDDRKYLAASTLLFRDMLRARSFHRMIGASYVMHPNVCINMFTNNEVKDARYMRGEYDTKPWVCGVRWRDSIKNQQLNLVLYCEHNRRNRFFTDSDRRLCRDLHHALETLVDVTKYPEFCYTELR